jgi:hypothetical protein
MIIDYTDKDGLRQRALVPNNGVDPGEGVPLSLPIRDLYGHMPLEFQVRLSDALFNRGLVEPRDFLRPGAAELTRNAILDVCKHDALSIISLAKSLLE